MAISVQGMACRAALRAIPERVPEHHAADSVTVSREVAHFWAHAWTGHAMMAVGTQHPVFTSVMMEGLCQPIRGCPPALCLPDAGHFVQERGEPVALAALRELCSLPDVDDER